MFKTSYGFAKEELKNILKALKIRFPDEKLSEFDLENINNVVFISVRRKWGYLSKNN